MARVLIVDDDANARLTVVRGLTAQGFETVEAANGEAALSSIESDKPDLVVLDINLPEMSGLDVLREVRRTHALPVILLTGRDEEIDRVVGLELGADDYVVKPFSVRELVARVGSVLRRAQPAATESARHRSLEFDRLTIAAQEREVRLDGALIELTPREFDLLACLAASPRRVFTRDELLKEVWGSATEWQDPATVTEHIRRLRRKIEADAENPEWLITVRGVGYRLDPPAAR